MARVYNFSAGPSMLPEPVLQTAAGELLDFQKSGMSVMEMSHRSKEFTQVMESADALLREVMGIPENYDVLFLQGGANLQFAMVPLNLFRKSKRADFIHTGQWSKKAIAEAKKYGTAQVVASSEDKTFSYIPEIKTESFDPDADYVHITTNNTIYGTRIGPDRLPETGDVPLVADMSSNILSEPYDVSKFGLIYAGAQKNIGPAGVTVVIVRKDLIGHAADSVPTMLNYKTHVDAGSMYNTPPCFSIYMAKLVFEWIKEQGGVAALAERNREKAGYLYEYLDNSKLFNATVAPQDRSIMNVPFVLPTDELNASFIAQAKTEELVTLKGHRTVGGMRASIYNAMPAEGVKKLVAFMKKFEQENS